jgi:hypothetical protein
MVNKVKSALTKSSTQAPRTRLINHFLTSSNNKSYLEIGVRYGEISFQKDHLLNLSFIREIGFF